MKSTLTNTDSDHVSAKQAQAALESLGQTTKSLELTCRPPLWLNLLASFALGLESYAFSLSSGNSLWTFVLLTSTAFFMLLILGWGLVLRLHGVQVHINPVGFKNKVIGVLQGLLIVVVMFANQYFYQQNIIGFPMVGALINAVGLFYILYKFPLGEFYKTGEH